MESFHLTIQLLESPCSSVRPLVRDKISAASQMYASWIHVSGSRIEDHIYMYHTYRIKYQGSWIHASWKHASGSKIRDICITSISIMRKCILHTCNMSKHIIDACIMGTFILDANIYYYPSPDCTWIQALG